MQPEDIIQAKEWRQLTEAERAALQPLAATEGEFNVLKKMLLIVQEDEVPQISPDVQRGLHAHLKNNSGRGRKMIWYAAAASILVLLVAAIFLSQPKKPENGVAVTPVAKPLQKKDTANKELLYAPTPSPQRTAPTIEVVKSKPPQKKITRPEIIKDTTANSNGIAAITTRLQDNATLLSFVTEVY